MADAGQGVQDAQNNNTQKPTDQAVRRRSRTHQNERQPALVYDSTKRADPVQKQPQESNVRTHASVATEEIKQTQASIKAGSVAIVEIPNDRTDVLVNNDGSVIQSAFELPEVVIVETEGSLDKNEVDVSLPDSASNGSKLKEGIILSSEGLVQALETGQLPDRVRSNSLKTQAAVDNSNDQFENEIIQCDTEKAPEEVNDDSNSPHCEPIVPNSQENGHAQEEDLNRTEDSVKTNSDDIKVGPNVNDSEKTNSDNNIKKASGGEVSPVADAQSETNEKPLKTSAQDTESTVKSGDGDRKISNSLAEFRLHSSKG